MTFGKLQRITHAFLDLRTESSVRSRFTRRADGRYRSDDSHWYFRVENGNYVLVLPGGMERVFNPEGLMTEIRDLWGNKVVLTYDENGRLQEAAHTCGVRFAFSYSNGKLAQLAVSDGLSLSLSYNHEDQLASASLHVGGQTRATTYSYTDGFLVSRTNPAGNTAYYDYIQTHNGLAYRSHESHMERGANSFLPYRMDYVSDTVRRVHFDDLVGIGAPSMNME